jgi:serine/threonine protein kinase/Tol biopolymer transport system component
MRDARPSNVVRFGAFELDLRAGELHKEGRKILLQEQPFQVLKMLLASPGEVLMREDIRRKLWPNDTAVEFDRSINAAVKKLRGALGDSAEEPYYVETVARRGYRLIVPVELVNAAPVDLRFEDSANTYALPILGNLTGRKVSHYRLLEILGGGGMGVVYKAEDLKLGRQVAIKFLPEELTKDPKTLERFEREARAASALDHPNICSIYEFGEQDGNPFIVMQLLEGQTLRDRIAGAGTGARSLASTQTRPFTIDQLIDLAVQITEGLEAAHQRGVIHRDIKPANIFVLHRGQAKILDFGLAKLNVSAKGCIPIINAPSAPSGDPSLTRTGAMMGTAAYMSPEQVEGEELDARTDLFSFGLVLYEMATGQQAFMGDTVALVREAILLETPVPVIDLNPALPPKLALIIQKAIEKRRNLRYQAASEVRADLELLKRDGSGQSPQRGRLFMLAAIVFMALLVGGPFWLADRQTAPVFELRQRQLTANSSENPVEEAAISPDGKYLAFSDMKGIHIKFIGTGDTQTIAEPEALKGTKVDWIVNWFPDSTRLLVTAHISAQRPSAWVASAMGGALRKIRDDAWAWAVSPDGASIIFTTKPGKMGDREMWLMGPNGEQARMLYETDDLSFFERIEWSPDGQRITYYKSHQGLDKLEATIESRDLKGGPATKILSTGPWWENGGIRDSNWLPGGRMIYLVEEDTNGPTCNYWELRIDPKTGEPRGKPRRLTHWAGFCMDYTTATSNGKQLAFTRGWALRNIYVSVLEGKATRINGARRLTMSESQELPAAWTLDSKNLVFTSDRNGRWGIFKQRLDRDTAELVATMPEGVEEARISPDGAWALLVVPTKTSGPSGAANLMRVSMTGGSPQSVLSAAIYDRPSCSRSPATLCALAERTGDHKQIIFTAFDPMKGRGHELTRLDIETDAAYTWDLSPDATRIAALKLNGGRIHVLSLTGQPAKEITVKGWSGLQCVDWTADGTGLYVSSAGKESSVLLYVDLQGNARVIWQHGGWGGTRGVPSPDGRRLAMLGSTHIGNVWMIENF